MATRFFYLSNLLAKLARLLLYTNSSTKMKKIYIVFIAVFLLVVSFEMQAQRRLTEATISYDIVINTSNKTPQAADLLDGATSVIYLKGALSRSDMVSSLGTHNCLGLAKAKNA